MRKYLLLLLFAGFTSCSPTKIIKYSKRPDETFANYNLKEFLRENRTPKIVLRVPNSSDKATSNSSLGKDNDVLFNAIEKEFLRQGYIVRDRGLFNEIIDKAGSSDYSKIQGLTDTDLILEVINIDRKVVYTTNKITVIKKKSESEVIQNIDYARYGASVEFRIIMVKNNEVAGSYKYHWRPCPQGCQLNNFVVVKRQVELRETISVNEMEEFITASTQRLINSLRE